MREQSASFVVIGFETSVNEAITVPIFMKEILPVCRNVNWGRIVIVLGVNLSIR